MKLRLWGDTWLCFAFNPTIWTVGVSYWPFQGWLSSGLELSLPMVSIMLVWLRRSRLHKEPSE
jgi:hypothetical protein